jgi:Fe-S-cluster containining protein
MTNNDLPCASNCCPHGSACCYYGVDVTEQEYNAIVADFGENAIVKNGDGNLRTACVDDRCIFLNNNKCQLHNKTYYPEVCRKFPLDGYESTLDICPSLKFIQEGK